MKALKLTLTNISMHEKYLRKMKIYNDQVSHPQGFITYNVIKKGEGKGGI